MTRPDRFDELTLLLLQLQLHSLLTWLVSQTQSISWAKFLAASMLVTSRGLTCPRTGVCSLPPLVPYPQHSWAPTAAFVQHGDSWCLEALVDLPARAEVTLSYEPGANNGELLARHGTVLDWNPHDAVVVPGAALSSGDAAGTVPRSVAASCCCNSSRRVRHDAALLTLVPLSKRRSGGRYGPPTGSGSGAASRLGADTAPGWTAS